MADLSSLDGKYFIDKHVYNCPFCNRRNVSYYVRNMFIFDWTYSKPCRAFLVQCSSCNKTSMHLTFEKVGARQTRQGSHNYQFDEDEDELDDKFFYSVPTSFFALNDHIPSVLRELMTEAEGCLKTNFLTGASVCARKLVYETAVIEKAEGTDYESRLKSLKAKRTDVDAEYFDTLLTIQQVTSDKVHEDSYDGWTAKHLRLILSTLHEILNALYVLPQTRIEKRKAALKLKEEILGTGAEQPAKPKKTAPVAKESLPRQE